MRRIALASLAIVTTVLSTDASSFVRCEWHPQDIGDWSDPSYWTCVECDPNCVPVPGIIPDCNTDTWLWSGTMRISGSACAGYFRVSGPSYPSCKIECIGSLTVDDLWIMPASFGHFILSGGTLVAREVTNGGDI